MSQEKIVLLTNPCDQGDILKEFIEWYLDLGVDLIVAQDVSSSDNTHEILNSFSNRGRLQWFALPERRMTQYMASDALAKMAIEQHGADWIIMCDVDEFLCPQGDDLRTIIQAAKNDDFTVLNVPCFNMTGPVLLPGESALENLTLRIDRPLQPTVEHMLSGDLPVPYIFIRHPPKTIVRAAAFAEYAPGAHAATSTWGQIGEFSQLRFLHYNIRGFDKLQKKVQNTAAWLADNPHLEPWWGWHWRRWIRWDQEGRLREDYENQFVSPARAEELIRDQICIVDETISSWLKQRRMPKKTPPSL
jgi:hypothetical protein